MQLINNKKDPTLLGKNASAEEIAAVQKQMTNLLKDSDYENAFKVVQKGPHIHIEYKGTN